MYYLEFRISAVATYVKSTMAILERARRRVTPRHLAARHAQRRATSSAWYNERVNDVRMYTHLIMVLHDVDRRPLKVLARIRHISRARGYADSTTDCRRNRNLSPDRRDAHVKRSIIPIDATTTKCTRTPGIAGTRRTASRGNTWSPTEVRFLGAHLKRDRFANKGTRAPDQGFTPNFSRDEFRKVVPPFFFSLALARPAPLAPPLVLSLRMRTP